MPEENSRPPERSLFDLLNTTVQQEAVQKLKGSSFGRKLVTGFLKNYHTDSGTLLDDPDLVRTGVGMVAEESDDEGKKRALVTIYNDMRILLALISEAQKCRRPPKTFPEAKIEEIMEKILTEVRKERELLSTRKEIEEIGMMVRRDFAARLNYVLPARQSGG